MNDRPLHFLTAHCALPLFTSDLYLHARTSAFSGLPASMAPPRHLPDLCLIALFQQMSVNDRLSASRMNSRWSNLVRVANLRVCSLVISNNVKDNAIKTDEAAFNSFFIGSSPSMRLCAGENGQPLEPVFRLNKWNCLKVNTSLDIPSIKQIVTIFPNITDFKFITYHLYYYEFLVNILQTAKWSHQLTSFMLIDNYKSPYGVISELANRLFKAINGLSSLKRLAINWSSTATGLFYLPIIAQLDEVFVGRFTNNNATFLSSLERYAAKNTRLQVHLLSGDLNTLFSLKTHLRDRIVRFVKSSGRLSFLDRGLSNFCNRFCLLKSLEITVTPDNSRYAFSLLSELPLVHLGMSIAFLNEQFEDTRPVKQCASVKALDLELFTASHSNVQWLNLKETLPSVEAIYIKSFYCGVCRINDHSAKVASQCFRTSLMNLHTGVPHNQIIFKDTSESSYLSLEQLFSK